MLFNSVAFVIFFPVILALYWAVPFRVQQWLILVASYVFYGWWGFVEEPHESSLQDLFHEVLQASSGDRQRLLALFAAEFFERALPLLLLVVSTVATHACARALHPLPEESNRRRMWFWLGVAINVGLLGYFKYRGFFMENVHAVATHFGWHVPTIVDYLLPAGISFYTFQGLSYLIDVEGGAQEPVRKLSDFAIFHAYFPQLVAGPIERSRNLLPQLMAPRTLAPEKLWSGLQLIIIGYVKKVAIADAIAPMTKAIFMDPSGHSGAALMLGVYLFALQMYGDFSGYSDIARGCARLLGVDLMVNFRQPYFSRNITEFWERWHISLSTWLRDYIFMPLCRRFRGRKWINFNLFLTMLISGIWHGASWNFVCWGIVLGVMLVIHKIWSGPKASKHPHRPRSKREWLLEIAGAILTFHCVCFTLIFVKTDTLADAWHVITGIIGGGYVSTDAIALVYVVFYGLLVFAIDFPCWWRDRELPVSENASPWHRGIVYGALLLLLAFIGEMEGVSFVYFQF